MTQAATPQIYDYLIIGAGPSGLAAALEIQRAGIKNYLVLEKGPSHSQMIRTYYKEAKRVDAQYAGLNAICYGVLCLKDGNRESFLAFMDHIIETNAIPIVYNTEVWSIVQNTKSQNFVVQISDNSTLYTKAVIVAIGKMGKPRQPDYWKNIPNTLKNNKSILFDINSRPLEGLSVLVVGGGDSACEYAQLLAEKSQVTLSYRKEKITRANDINRQLTSDLVASQKIQSRMPSDIAEITDANGKPQVHFVQTEIPPQIFDVVLYGLGGKTPTEFLRSSGVALDADGEVVVSEIKETSIPRLYVVGDLLGKGRGGGSIISGFNSATAAVRASLKKDFALDLPVEMVSLEHLKF